MRFLILATLIVFSSTSWAHSSLIIEVPIIDLGSEIRDYSYDFGRIRIQWPAYMDYNVVNTTNGNIYVQDFNIYGKFYTGYQSCPYQIGPGESCRIHFKYEANDFGDYKGCFILSTSKGDYRIRLHGSSHSLREWETVHQASSFLKVDACDSNPPVPK